MKITKSQLEKMIREHVEVLLEKKSHVEILANKLLRFNTNLSDIGRDVTDDVYFQNFDILRSQPDAKTLNHVLSTEMKTAKSTKKWYGDFFARVDSMKKKLESAKSKSVMIKLFLEFEDFVNELQNMGIEVLDAKASRYYGDMAHTDWEGSYSNVDQKKLLFVLNAAMKSLSVEMNAYDKIHDKLQSFKNELQSNKGI